MEVAVTVVRIVCHVACLAALVTRPPIQTPVTAARQHLERRIAGALVIVEYRPQLLGGRTVADSKPTNAGNDGLPLEAISRLGKGESATLSTDRTLTFADLIVPPGTYTLFVRPGPSEWKLIVSKSTDIAAAYQFGQELGVVPMRLVKLPASIEEMTLSLEEQNGRGVLAIRWGLKQAQTDFAVR
jgi:hypothetical protein